MPGDPEGEQDPRTLGERGYLALVRQVIEEGDRRSERTGVGTLAKFGCQLRFDLAAGFPLLTTKRVFWKGIVEELLWFISGSTDARKLQDKGVRIWDGNSSRAYLDRIGLQHREEGDLGPVYGFQWRHFGARYTDMHADYSGQGTDQLARVISTLKTNPTDRRMLLCSWNPADLPLMALPPCHLLAQFFVERGRLSCQVYQRSCDLGLGVPFNIGSYALLVHLIAHLTGLIPGELIFAMGDTHVYQNHLGALTEQLSRPPRPLPRLAIRGDIASIGDFTADHLELSGYDPHPALAMEMAV
jgi:thymidylate synthase